MDVVEEELVEDKGDDLEVLSQCTDEGSKEDEQWSDSFDMAKEDLYTVEQINTFLDETKGRVGVDVERFFLILRSL